MGGEAAPASVGVGTMLAGTYRVTHLLGRGGMGSVWVAEHTRLPGKKVAIKVLHRDVAADEESLARFRREAEIATRLGHPNIVEVHDFNLLEDGTPYLVLELLQGQDLATRLRDGALPLDETCSIVRQIGSALSTAHRENIVHRDLKPHNVFLCPTESGGIEGTEAKVLDFGISKIRGSQTVKTNAATMLGTPQYMAPEQALGNHAAVDARTDIFALGAMVYEMLSGRPGFLGESIPEVVFKVVYEEPPRLDTLVAAPPGVIDAVHRALSKKQEERFPDVTSFVEALTGSPLNTLRRGAVIAPGDGGSAGAPTEPPALKKSNPVSRSNPPQVKSQEAYAATIGSAPRPVDAALAATIDSSKQPLDAALAATMHSGKSEAAAVSP
ncbi:MAG TPA: serine/threonine-protein kinase, partial [Kofleriaceae bacterium]|nr:serine/threonine-protein kinase [Kofleriaceae bacterium]